ncbi:MULTISPECIES: ABC transporter permease subunit [Micromonospora]|uniref:ABC transporter permease n=1 Tax=Micromonospora sicca TaxID=2202420 RepID=A0A317D6U3_9ACTN|nr:MULTISPECIES: ABC transporter permease subunit [unclassified Micromonospora]MBM0225173.1 ABC transporter permease subunit [Micromonospora sp. ATA51]PWR10568.1 ABC transporter permease [Micromonospora sp. 4G51]
MTTPRTVAPARPASRPVPAGGPFTGAVAAEWTKLWSVRSTWWTLLAGVLVMAATAGQLAIYAANANTDDDPANNPGVVTVGSIVIGSLDLTQYAVLALGLLTVTSEYATGTIRTTLRCTPSRGRMLLAKAVVVAVVTFLFGLLLGGVGALVAGPVLGGWGRVPVAGTLGDALAAAVYLALVAVLALGLTAALRGAVLTLTVLLAALMIVPLSLQEPRITVLTRIADAFPGVAGAHFMAGDTDPYPAAAGVLLLAGWTVAALALGRAALRRRDA